MNRREISTTIYNNIHRSIIAYDRYLNNKTYYNALHIYKANEVIYTNLNLLLSFKLTENELKKTIDYILHLEDWFTQFEYEEQKVDGIIQTFVFKSFDDYIPFPKDYIKTLVI